VGANVTVLSVAAFDGGAPAEIPSNLRTAIASATLRKGLPLAWKSDVIVAGREVVSGLLIGTALAKLIHRPLAVTIQNNVDQALARMARIGTAATC